MKIAKLLKRPKNKSVPEIIGVCPDAPLPYAVHLHPTMDIRVMILGDLN
jgi:hypothetical protein